jgi:hypothetical protein
MSMSECVESRDCLPASQSSHRVAKGSITVPLTKITARTREVESFGQSPSPFEIAIRRASRNNELHQWLLMQTIPDCNFPPHDLPWKEPTLHRLSFLVLLLHGLHLFGLDPQQLTFKCNAQERSLLDGQPGKIIAGLPKT